MFVVFYPILYFVCSVISQGSVCLFSTSVIARTRCMDPEWSAIERRWGELSNLVIVLCRRVFWRCSEPTLPSIIITHDTKMIFWERNTSLTEYFGDLSTKVQTSGHTFLQVLTLQNILSRSVHDINETRMTLVVGRLPHLWPTSRH